MPMSISLTMSMSVSVKLSFFLYLSIDLPTSTWEDVRSPSSGECRSKWSLLAPQGNRQTCTLNEQYFNFTWDDYFLVSINVMSQRFDCFLYLCLWQKCGDKREARVKPAVKTIWKNCKKIKRKNFLTIQPTWVPITASLKRGPGWRSCRDENVFDLMKKHPSDYQLFCLS